LPDGLTEIDGDVEANEATKLVSLAGKGLKTIKGTFTLKGLTVLTALSFPELVSVKDIAWTTLPALSELGFTKEVTSADNVMITDTNLASLDGINLQECTTFNVNNNKYLKTVDVALRNVYDILTITFNGNGVKTSFPELQWAKNITIRNAGSVSFPKLEEVKSSVSLINNTFEEVEFPELTKVGQSMALVSCNKLSNLTANSLESVGGTFLLANNTKLETVDGFKKLSKVGGAIDLSGTFKKVSLPSLSDVRGSLNLQSTNKLDCTAFDKIHSQGDVIKGNDYVCKGEKDTATSAQGGFTTSGSKNSSSKKDESGSAGRAGFSIALAGLASALGLMFL